VLLPAQEEESTNPQGLEAYQLVEKMGDGAFSNVYKAFEKATGQKVAVKVVRKYELNSSQVRAVRACGVTPLPLYSSGALVWSCHL
jgi:serine/threonine protein kinase